MARNEKNRRAVEWGKNLLIVLLSLSALYLLWCTQLQSSLPGQAGGGLSGLLELFRPQQSEQVSQQAVPGAVRPVRLAVYFDGQRYGVQYNTAAADAAFGELSTLLSEALGSAEAPVQIGEQAWREALCRDGVYFDFLTPLPLATLSAWLEGGAGNPELAGTARRMCLAGNETGGVSLFYHNEDDGLYYACETTLSQQLHLDSAVSEWPPNGALFAFEVEGMEILAPYTMLSTTPQPGTYTAANPLATDPARLETLLSALSFHPQSGTLDPVSGGQAIEGSDTLRLDADGTVTFHSIGSDDSRFLIPGGSEGEILSYVRLLAESTAGAWCGAARLYLDEYVQTEDGWVITFQYTLEGAAVSLPEGQDAARFLVQDGAVTDFTLCLRTYTATGQTSPVMPEHLAAAAMGALEADGMELELCYHDSGGELVSAGWVAG